MTTVEELLDDAEETIKDSPNVDLWRQSDARVNAEELLGAVLRKEIGPDDLEIVPSAAQRRRFRRLVKRRAAGEPVALIVGYADFMDMKLKIRKGVFLPRHSSELLASKAMQRIRGRHHPVAVDVATGMGPVALAIARGVSHAEVYGLDIWEPSLRLARENARLLGLHNVTFMKSNMLSRLPRKLRGAVDVFTIHPPYVGRRELSSLPIEVKSFEPKTSLTDGSADGLGLVRALAAEAPEWLTSGGWLSVEVSPDLARRVRSVLTQAGYSAVKSQKDSLGATRVISGRFSPR